MMAVGWIPHVSWISVCQYHYKEAETDPRTGSADIDTAGNALSHYLLDLAINQCKTASRFVSSFALIP